MQPGDIDNRELVNLLRRHKHGTEPIENILGALRQALLLLPTAGDEAELAGGDITALGDASRSIYVLENINGQMALPVFTHEGALREWDPSGAKYSVAPAIEIFGAALERGVAAVLVNPGSPEGLQIGPPGMRALT